MKKILYTLVACSLLATACRKDDKNETGLATMTVNGQSIQFITDANLHNNAFSVNFNFYDQLHVLRVQFDLTAMPFNVDTYDVYPFLKKYPSSFLYTSADKA